MAKKGNNATNMKEKVNEDFLKMTPGDFVERYTRLTADRSGLSLIEKADGACVFLTETRPPACRIEAVKPRQCRDFPEKWNFPGWEKLCEGASKEH